jgi:hypothetical protein
VIGELSVRNQRVNFYTPRNEGRANCLLQQHSRISGAWQFGRFRLNRHCARIDGVLYRRNLRALAIAIAREHPPSERLRGFVPLQAPSPKPSVGEAAYLAASFVRTDAAGDVVEDEVERRADGGTQRP